VLVINLVLLNLNSSLQKRLVNILSLSDTTDAGMPCSRTTNIQYLLCHILSIEKMFKRNKMCIFIEPVNHNQ
jgi:hypothetical protein